MWALISTGVTARNFAALHAQAKRFLDGLPFDRIETGVDCDFPQGHRWMKALGFTMESPRMRKFQNGRDHALYARVK